MDQNYGHLEKLTKIDSLSLKKKCCENLKAPVKDEITGEWRRINNIELKSFYSGSDILKVIGRR